MVANRVYNGRYNQLIIWHVFNRHLSVWQPYILLLNHTQVPFSGWHPYKMVPQFVISIGLESLLYKVVPQFGIAKLVQITPITIWFMVDILTYLLWFINQLITGGYHLVQFDISNINLATSLVLSQLRHHLAFSFSMILWLPIAFQIHQMGPSENGVYMYIPIRTLCII